MAVADATRDAHAAAGATTPAPGVTRLACVSYLNAKPLIAGLGNRPDAAVTFDVPARLRPALERGDADAALLPVFDAIDAAGELAVVPAGGIGCDGPTLTVRLFSRAPIDAVRRVALDTDSRTSVNLLKVLLAWRGVAASYRPWSMGEPTPPAADADAVLMIGDKVVAARPDAGAFPHGLDLGEAWKSATGLPFVFAAWTARRGVDAAPMHRLLAAARRQGEASVDALVAEHAAAHGWPRDLARRYLGEVLRYAIGPREIEAMRRYGAACAELGLTDADGRLTLAGS